MINLLYSIYIFIFVLNKYGIFFFYNNLTNEELIKKINNKYTITDGYINIENYDKENNILTICKNKDNKTTGASEFLTGLALSSWDVLYLVSWYTQ
jgi:hypothetical protein